MDVELNCFSPSKPALNKENSALLFTNVYYTPGIRGANQLHVLKTDVRISRLSAVLCSRLDEQLQLLSECNLDIFKLRSQDIKFLLSLRTLVTRNKIASDIVQTSQIRHKPVPT